MKIFLNVLSADTKFAPKFRSGDHLTVQIEQPNPSLQGKNSANSPHTIHAEALPNVPKAGMLFFERRSSLICLSVNPIREVHGRDPRDANAMRQ